MNKVLGMPRGMAGAGFVALLLAALAVVGMAEA